MGQMRKHPREKPETKERSVTLCNGRETEDTESRETVCIQTLKSLRNCRDRVNICQHHFLDYVQDTATKIS